MKKNKINKEKVKVILKKSLDVFCYIITALAVTLGIAMGINSCSGSSEPTRVDPQQELIHSLRQTSISEAMEYNVYASNFEEGTISHDFDGLRSAMGIPSTIYAQPQVQQSVRYYFDSETYWIADNGDLHRVGRLGFQWDTYAVAEGVTQYEYKLSSVYIHDLDAVDLLYFYSRTSIYSTEDLGNVNRGRLVVSEVEINDVGFLAFWHLAEKKPFTFNENFNYNAPMGLNISAVFGETSFDGGQQAMRYKDYDIGWFYSNGRIFNKIRWYAINTQGIALMINGNISVMTSDIEYIYTMMYYINTVSNTEVLVNSRDVIPYNEGNSRYWANSATWSVPAYREIVLLSEISDTIRDTLLAFNNNNQTTYGGGLVSSDVNDVFSLISTAFSGLIPILTIAILPNITLGTLLFVPLVAMIVFAIIRIIKK